MNKIFRVIWNKTTQRLEVVSELARVHGKATSSSNATGEVSNENTGSFKVKLLSALLALSFSFIGSNAYAAISIGSTNNNAFSAAGATTNDGTVGEVISYGNPDNLTYLNRGADLVSGSYSGHTDDATNSPRYANGIAIGNHTVATGYVDVNGVRTQGLGIALGDYANSTGQNTIAIG